MSLMDPFQQEIFCDSMTTFSKSNKLITALVTDAPQQHLLKFNGFCCSVLNPTQLRQYMSLQIRDQWSGVGVAECLQAAAAASGHAYMTMSRC